MSSIDQWVTRFSRRIAQQTSRRSFLARFGVLVVGGATLPLLPVARVAEAAPSPQRAPAPGEPDPSTPEGDPNNCNYWRYCAVDGFLSSCCGGTHRTCPTGTEMSPVTWVGTCRNPKDGKDYIVSYNDCCGKNVCGRCYCFRNEGDRPVYFPSKSNDIDWCMGRAGIVYNSTTSVVIGIATVAE